MSSEITRKEQILHTLKTMQDRLKGAEQLLERPADIYATMQDIANAAIRVAFQAGRMKKHINKAAPK